MQNTDHSSFRREPERLHSAPISAFFAAQAIKIDDDNDEAARDDALPEWIYVQQVCAVIDRRQDEGAEERAVHRADRTKKACAAEAGGSNRLQFPSFR